MRDGTLLSGILHSVVIGVLVVGLPAFVQPPVQTVIPVEMVILEEEKPEPEPPQQQAKAVPEPVTSEPEPEQPVEEKTAEPEPEPLPPPEAKPEPEKLAKPTPPKPKRRPDIKVTMPDKYKNKDKPKPDQLTSILRNVEKLRDQPSRRREQTARAELQGATRRVSSLEQNEMVRAIQEQLRRCWRIDPGAREAENMVVEIKVLLNPDGSVQTAEIVDVVRMVQDGYFRSAAENARRAINQCSPFRLPPRKYQVWRQLTLRFDPREMFGT